MARIFISYKRKNKEQVFQIVKYIESQLGEKCWVDLDGIESSAQFGSVICKAIDNAEVILFMHSSVHLSINFETDWTIKELNYAQNKKKRIVLVKLDASPLENIFLLEYGTKNNIDSRDSIQLQNLVRDLRRWLGISQQQSVTSPNSNVQVKSASEEAKLCDSYIDMVIHQKWAKITETKKQVEALAQKGKTDAEYALGFGEYRPYGSNIRIGGDQHYRLAEQWLGRAAKKGHVKAQALLADMYYWGKEPEKAIPWATSATNHGDSKAARILAWCYRKLNDNSKYVESIKLAAQLQESTKSRDIHCPAMEYGKVLLEGIITRQDLDEAIRWFDVAIKLSYDIQHTSDAVYYKAKALYEQGHKLKALWCLGDTRP